MLWSVAKGSFSNDERSISVPKSVEQQPFVVVSDEQQPVLALEHYASSSAFVYDV